MRRFTILTAMIAMIAAPVLLDAAEPKDPNPPGPGQVGTAARATGGPDTFGYTFADGAEPGVTFDWVDITGTGTALGGGDDAGYPVTLGAPFNIYGTAVSSVAMTTNGYISTDPTDTGPDLSNDCPLPATPSTGGGARIYPLQDDLITADMYYEYFAVCPRQNERCAIAEDCSIFFWDGTEHYPAGGATWQMEVVLYHQTNDVVAQIGPGNAELGSGSTTGIQNEAADDGLTYACNTDNSIPDNTVVQFFHPNDITAYCQPGPRPVPSLSSTGILVLIGLLVVAAFAVIRLRF